MERSLGVRKGAWTGQEDVLLRKCIDMFGEGKWHQVPLRAGLNRCRKSCRLRWLNYLKPNINRGKFTVDEVDLIIRLHKLLGNRWSLIAGRLPGRTANDVKNYWNTHFRKKVFSRQEEVKDKTKKTVKVNIIRPRPLTFSKNLPWFREKTTLRENIQPGDNLIKPSATKPAPQENEVMWWESLLFGNDCDEKITCSNKSGSEKDLITNLWVEENEPPTNVENTCVNEGNSTCWSTDLSLDVDLWNFLNDEEQKTMM